LVKLKGQAKRLEIMYQQLEDPWGFESEDYERERYEETIGVLDRPTYQSVLEVGCGEGAFTVMLKDRAERILGVDISPTAIERASRRVADLPRISFRAMDISEELPDGPFDLIICSEVLYYVHPFRRLAVAKGLFARLTPDGEMLLVHSIRDETRDWPDLYGEGGAEGLHRLFTKYLGMSTLYGQTIDDYRIDLVCPDPDFSGYQSLVGRIRFDLGNIVAVGRRNVFEAARAGRGKAGRLRPRHRRAAKLPGVSSEQRSDDVA
jgi:SAM-dependent methyltransferase